MIPYGRVMFILWFTLILVGFMFVLCLTLKRGEALIAMGAVGVTLGNLIAFSRMGKDYKNEK